MSKQTLNGKDLYDQGYRLCHEGKWPMLITPDDKLLRGVEKVTFEGERFYAFEMIAAIERDTTEELDTRRHTNVQQRDRLGLLGKTLERSAT